MNEAIQPSPSHLRQPASAPTADLPARRLATTENPLRVLLAEDSQIVSERLVALINGLGRPIRVVTAANGSEAARLLDEAQPDVAVLDIALPGVNGFGLLAAFKSKRPDCLVIMLTTYVYPEFRETAARLGADFFFSKVLEFERVAEVLNSLTLPPDAAKDPIR